MSRHKPRKPSPSKRCPDCGRRITVYSDGTFTMHAKEDGSLCSGTNVLFKKRATISICGVPINVTNLRYDSDATSLADEMDADA